jgi:hypothetical protein
LSCENSGFESKAAVQAPAGFGKGLYQLSFTQALRLVFIKVSFDVLLEDGGMVRSKQNGAAGQTCFERILRRYGFAFFGARAGRGLRIEAIAFGGGHEWGVFLLEMKRPVSRRTGGSQACRRVARRRLKTDRGKFFGR